MTDNDALSRSVFGDPVAKEALKTMQAQIVPHLAILGPRCCGKSCLLQGLARALNGPAVLEQPSRCLVLDLRGIQLRSNEEIEIQVVKTLVAEAKRNGFQINLKGNGPSHLNPFFNALKMLVETTSGLFVLGVDHLECVPLSFAELFAQQLRSLKERIEGDFGFQRIGFLIAGSVSLCNLRNTTDSIFAQAAPFLMPRCDHSTQVALVRAYVKSCGTSRLSQEVIESLVMETGGEPSFLVPLWQRMKELGPVRQFTSESVRRAAASAVDTPSSMLRELGVRSFLDDGLRGVTDDLIGGRAPLLRHPFIDIDPYQLQGAVTVQNSAGIETYRFRNRIVQEFLKKSFPRFRGDFWDSERKAHEQNTDIVDLLQARHSISTAETLAACSPLLARAWEITTAHYSGSPRFHVAIRSPHREPFWLEIANAGRADAQAPRPEAAENAEALASTTRTLALGWDRDHVALSLSCCPDILAGTITATASRGAGAFTETSLSTWAQFLENVAAALIRLALVEVGTRHLLSAENLSAKEKNGLNQNHWHIFMSYSSIDKEHAGRLQRAALKKGLKIYIAEKELSGGDEFMTEIRDALLSSSELCVLVTPQSLKSTWVITEWGAAWALGKKVTPILLRCNADQLPDRLKLLECVDFHDAPRFFGAVAKRIGFKMPELPPKEIKPKAKRANSGR